MEEETVWQRRGWRALLHTSCTVQFPSSSSKPGNERGRSQSNCSPVGLLSDWMGDSQFMDRAASQAPGQSPFSLPSLKLLPHSSARQVVPTYGPWLSQLPHSFFPQEEGDCQGAVPQAHYRRKFTHSHDIHFLLRPLHLANHSAVGSVLHPAHHAQFLPLFFCVLKSE